MKRRNFLRYTAAVTAGMVIAGPTARILGANEDIRFGIIGAGQKGMAHAAHITKIPGVRLVAMADPDPGYKMAALKAELAKQEKPIQIDTYTDFRKLLDRKDIDAVIIASPNHWHALHGICALQAGKHVYIEKPVSHDIWQGQQLVRQAQRSGLIVQAGLQHRSRHCWLEIMQYLEEGHLGKITCARALSYRRRKSIGKRTSPLTPPATCDYDLWLGPALDVPMYRGQFHYDWHWVWNTGNGDLANMGVHQIDIARWLIGENSTPEHIFSIGGRFGYDDAGQTPNTQIVYYDYQPIPLIAEVCGLPVEPGIEAMPIFMKTRVGTIIECEGGYIAEDVAYDKNDKRMHKFSTHGDERHLPRFIEAVRNRKPDSVPCSIEDGCLSTALCHLGNISYRLGQSAQPDDITEHLKANARQTDAWQRFAEHLEINQVDLSKHPAALGPMLSFDGKTERFTGGSAEKANALVKDNYRKKWTVPEIA